MVKKRQKMVKKRQKMTKNGQKMVIFGVPLKNRVFCKNQWKSLLISRKKGQKMAKNGKKSEKNDQKPEWLQNRVFCKNQWKSLLISTKRGQKSSKNRSKNGHFGGPKFKFPLEIRSKMGQKWRKMAKKWKKVSKKGAFRVTTFSGWSEKVERKSLSLAKNDKKWQKND